MRRPVHLNRHNPFVLFYGVFVVLLCFSIALIFSSSPAKSAPEPCMTTETMGDQARKKFPRSKLLHFKSEAAVEFIRIWNRIPPASNVSANQLMALVHGRGAIVETVFFQNGCALFREAIPGGLFLKIMQFIASQKSKDIHA